MPVLWQSSQRPMYVRTVWVGGFRHAILTHDDPYFLKLKRRRPHSSASCGTNNPKNSRLSHHSDDLQDCLRKLNLVITSGKSRINQRIRPGTGHEDIERLNLYDIDQESDNGIRLRTNSPPLTETSRSCSSLGFDMRHLKSNKNPRTDVPENTDLSDRVLQWLDLAGKIDLLKPDNVERMTQPRHSWPELQRRHNLAKSKTAIDIRKEGGRTTPKGDSSKAQQSGIIDRHDFYVPTSANTIENYARQSRNAKITPRHETSAKIKDNLNKTKSRELKTNVVETRQKVISEKSAVQKQYADMLSKKLIPDVSKNPKRQVHIFMPDLPKKLESTTTSRTESLLSQPTYKLLNNKV